jgi:hypothetical protein
LTGLTEYIDHVGYHLEQLALFALPRLEKNARDPSDFDLWSDWDPTELSFQKPRWSTKYKGESNEQSSSKPRADASFTQTLSARTPTVLKEHPVQSFEPPGKGKEAAFLDNAMSDIRSPDLVKPNIGKKAFDSRDYRKKMIISELPIATRDVPTDEQETKGKGKVRDEGAWSYIASPQRESDGNKRRPPAFSGHFISDLLPFSAPHYSVPAHLQPVVDYPGSSLPDPIQPSKDYPGHSMPAYPQSPGDNPTLQPPTAYSGYYMPQQHHPVVQAPALGSFAEVSVSCVYPGCTVPPFKRRTDLEHHIKDTHSTESNKDVFLCDYSGFCKSFHRRDHLRDHLREYHGEDVSEHEASSIMVSGLTIWRRCPHCLGRIYVSDRGYECPDCETPKPNESKRYS